jgi:hypothetical protein
MSHKNALRSLHLLCFLLTTMLPVLRGAVADEAWIVQDGGQGKNCSLSRADRGRTFSVTLAVLPGGTEQGIVSLTFDERTLIQGARRSAIAKLQFSNGAAETHRIEQTADGHLLVPMVTLNLRDLLQTFEDSRKLTVATRFGSASFDLDGIADHIPVLRRCAGS